MHTSSLKTDSALTLVDSHCHLNYPEIYPNLEQFLSHANDQAVRYCMTINTRLSESVLLQEIADQYPRVFCTTGVHPHEAAEHDIATIRERLKTHANHPKVVGIGETGLDYYYDHSPRAEQITSFDIHLAAATDLDLPVIIHTRDADQDTLSTVDNHPHAKGVFHCFSGDLSLAKAALDRGYYLSFSGIITFKKADVLREVVKFTPLDRLLVETDSPFLAPIPHRGQPNQPAWTRVVAEKVAEIKGLSIHEIAHATTENFFTLFNKAKLES